MTAVVSPALLSVLTRLRQAGRQIVLVTFGDSTASAAQGILSYSIRGEQLLA